MGNISEKVRECLDMDEWQHSWHNKFNELEDYLKARDVINKKIADRINELKTLSEGLNEIDIIIARERENI